MADPVKIAQANEEQEVPYDTGDEKQVNTARKKNARTRAHRLEFVAAAMTTEQGRAWFYDLLLRTYIFKNPYISDSPTDTSFRCGELNIGLQVLDDIQTAAPELYLTMIKENKTKNG